MALIVDNSPSSCGGGDGGMLLSLDSHKSVPAPFLTKTYQLVDDPSTDHVVSWGEDDSTFVVWRPPEFARDLLPNYFKHNNFSSFVRQLNTYGFRKIVPDRWEFANDFFKKGEKHLLCEIHRHRTTTTTTIQVASSPSPTDSASLPPTTPSTTTTSTTITTTVTALSEDNERLRRSNNMLMTELSHMKKLYNDIIYFVQNHVKPVPPPNSSAVKPLGFNNNNMMMTMMKKAPHVQVLHNGTAATTSTITSPTYSNKSNNSQSTVTILEEIDNHQAQGQGQGRCNNTKLFGVAINQSSKKRLHPEEYSNHHHHQQRRHPMMENSSKSHRLALDKDDLGLNLMPPSAC
ncbi:Heat stress transcription factor B-4 [Linum perenne]